MPQRRGDRLIITGRIDQRDAGPAAAEVAHRDDAAGRYPRVGPHREQRGRRVGDQQWLGFVRPFRHPAQRGTQRVDRGRPPVGGISQRDIVGQGPSTGGGVGQSTQTVDHQSLATVHRAVGRHDADRVPNPVHEVAHD
ncbi:hypothetical protein LAUMK15_03592 [Mycobacterium persicum]|nr:hypothetical protein LAUMK15_03592 [Mycobacterium persicum]